MKGAYAVALYEEEPVGTFADGHVFVNAPDLSAAERDPQSGYWRCDIADDDRLTWSEKVYALFGLPNGAPVVRDWAVAQYAEPSRTTLERVRSFALNRKLGFILDAAIRPEDGGTRWIRVLAVPIVGEENGRVVGLHGLKKSLPQQG